MASRARRRAKACAGAAAALLAAVATHAADHTVVIENMRFAPADLTVHAGDRVIWRNNDLVPHTATAADGAFDSRSIDPGRSWSLTVSKSGDHAYACTFHPTMTGTVTVR